MKQTLQQYCESHGSPHVLAQWHPTKNGALTPAQVQPGTHRKVWWRCEQGHEWEAQVNSRVAGNGCPVCTNRIVVPGDNDLATTHPWLAGQWHPDKNGALAPRNVVSGSRRRVWWRCEKGHEWMAAVNSRAHGAGCPVCSGKTVIPGDNDLASNWPELAAQWDQESNGSLRPDQVTTFCNQRVWWQCEKGHRWQAAINARATSGSGCPYCTGKRVLKGFNDLETLKPRIAAEWHPTLNGPLSPDMVTSGSAKRVWWQCAYGHVWRAIIYSRTGGRQCGCPVCAGKVKTRDKLNREYSFTPD